MYKPFAVKSLCHQCINTDHKHNVGEAGGRQREERDPMCAELNDLHVWTPKPGICFQNRKSNRSEKEAYFYKTRISIICAVHKNRGPHFAYIRDQQLGAPGPNQAPWVPALSAPFARPVAKEWYGRDGCDNGTCRQSILGNVGRGSAMLDFLKVTLLVEGRELVVKGESTAYFSGYAILQPAEEDWGGKNKHKVWVNGDSQVVSMCYLTW